MKNTTPKKVPEKIIGKVGIKIRTPKVKRGGVHKSNKAYSRRKGKSIGD